MGSRRDDTEKQRPWLGVFAMILIGGGILVALLCPVTYRYVAYNAILDGPGGRSTLAAHPTDLVLSYSGSTTALSLGYAQTALPTGWRQSAKIQGSAVIFFGNADESVVFMPPVFDTSLSADGNYTEAMATTRVARVGLSELITMGPAEYRRLARRSLAKSINEYNAHGIGHFETEHVRGIIRFGPSSRAGDINVEVWSKSGRISQGVLIRTQDDAAAFRLARCVVTQLNYTVDRVPPEAVLQDLLQNALKTKDLVTEPAEVRPGETR